MQSNQFVTACLEWRFHFRWPNADLDLTYYVTLCSSSMARQDWPMPPPMVCGMRCQQILMPVILQAILVTGDGGWRRRASASTGSPWRRSRSCLPAPGSTPGCHRSDPPAQLALTAPVVVVQVRTSWRSPWGGRHRYR